MVVQFSDIAQYIWGKLLGRHKIAPVVSPNKTWEGFLGGVATASLLGMGLWWMTPFTRLEALGMSLLITLLALCNRLTTAPIAPRSPATAWMAALMLVRAA